MWSRELKADDSGHSFAEHCRPDSSTEPERLQTTASFFRERQCSLKPKLNGSVHGVNMGSGFPFGCYCYVWEKARRRD